MDPFLLSAIIENVTTGVTVADASDPDLPLVFVNHGFELVTGYKTDEAVGRSCRFLQGKDRDQPGLTELRNALKNQESCVVRIRNYRKDGSLFHNELHISPIYNADGKVTHFVGIQHDVTDQVRTRDALEKSEERLKESLAKEKELNEIKSAFISMISHEFRTPMTGIQTSAALLHKYGDVFDEAKRERHFKNVEASLKRMNRLIDDVLFFSRVEAQKVKVNCVPVNLHNYIHGMIERLTPVFDNREVQIDCRFNQANVYLLDEHLLDHILHNLVGNALKYSPLESNVKLTVEEEKDILRFIVQDWGIGIPEADQKQLFEPFHRAKNVSTRQGTGLGLNIAQRAVELLGGEISFESLEEEGSTFIVQLPIALS